MNFESRVRFIFLMFPGGEKSIARCGMYNEVFEGKLGNVKVADYAIWKMKLQDQIDYIEEMMSDMYDYILVFVPGTDFDAYSNERLIVNLRSLDNPPKAIVSVLTDEVGRQAILRSMSGKEYIERYLKRFDVVYTWDLYDVEKYGLVYAEAPLTRFEHENINKGNKVFFIGRDKGRLKMIREIAQYFEKNDIDYEFLIYKNENGIKDTEYAEKGIKKIEYIRYDEITRKIQESGCILGLTAEYVKMIPAAFREAILYNKKLLTNCTFLDKIPYYNGDYMKAFNSVEDIDAEWLKKEETVKYDYKDQYDVRKLFEKIEDDYRMGMLKRVVQLRRDAVVKNNQPEYLIVDFHPLDLKFKAMQATTHKEISIKEIIPEGYRAEAIIQRSTGNNNLYYFRTTIDGTANSATIQLKNLSDTEIVASPSMQIVCRKI